MGTHVYPVKIRLRSGGATVDPARVQAFIDTEPGIVRDLMRRADNAANYQRRACPRHTGLLQSTIRTQLSRRPRPSASGGSRPAALAIAGREGLTPYLGYVLNGTNPHVIVPNRAKALRFVSGGQVRFAKRVNHPGTRAKPFVQDSARAART
ncbi:MAG: hypothetical protein L0I76_29000 [Pseudonocardia sp.]|nr:hypothetical protein [Pseudonocardia sp.]